MRNEGLILALMALPLWGQGISQGERDYALSQLHATRKMLLDSIDGLSEAQWKFKPAADRWSIAEVAEHVALTEDLLFGVMKKMLGSPAAPGRKGDREADQKVMARMADRGTRAQNPREAAPAGKWSTPEEAAREFRERRERTLDYVRTTKDDLRSHVRGSGENAMDAYQALVMIAGHTERHVAQIEEVKADPGYPR